MSTDGTLLFKVTVVAPGVFQKKPDKSVSQSSDRVAIFNV